MPDEDRAELEGFLATCVESYEALEVLLLLHAERTRVWSLADLAGELHTREYELEAACVALCDAGLVQKTGQPERQHVAYAPADARREAAVDALVRAYAVDRLGIVKIMNANAIDRIRNAATRVFADAFLIGRSKKDG